ncbi:amidohydrolase family protein, partial [Verrucomicrobia bacterium]|nr:amidohydrolase family protein [Verrucomicrobiota bacterium]
HLDYTAMAGMIPPLKHFSDWIKSIIAIKASWSYTEFAKSWVSGARMLEASGVTSVVDIEAVPELLPEAWQSTSLRVWSCLELINIRSSQPAIELVSNTLEQAQILESSHRNRCGLSPHALYTTSEALRKEARIAAELEHRILTTHVAESREELAMYQSANGPLFDWLGKQDSAEHCGDGSPVHILEKTGYLDSPLLAAHVNELGLGDEQRLAKHRASVVHCPRSHQYFGHTPFPWRKLQEAGVNLTLGTDSLASVQQKHGKMSHLDLFEEMKSLASQPNAPSPEEILNWATINAAKAIFQDQHLGQITAGFLADLIAIPYGGSMEKAYEAIISHQGRVSFSMIGGEKLDMERNTSEQAQTST